MMMLLVLVVLLISTSVSSFGLKRIPTKGLMTKIVAASIGAAAFSGSSLAPVPAVYAVEQPAYVGSYSDPNHPGCARTITVAGKDVIVAGSDNVDGSAPWKLIAKTQADGSLIIDFSPKGGPADLKSVYGGNALSFPAFGPDAKWTKL